MAASKKIVNIFFDARSRTVRPKHVDVFFGRAIIGVMGTRTDDLATLASRVKYARELAGLSQRQLSTAAGLSNQTISNVEAGFGTRVGTIEAIAKALDVSLGWLLEGKGEPPSRDGAAP